MTQLRAAVARKRKREIIRLQRLRQDNSAAKVIFVGTCGAHRLAFMTYPMSPSGEAPESRPEWRKNLIEFGALYSFVTNRNQKASGDRARVAAISQLVSVAASATRSVSELLGVFCSASSSDSSNTQRTRRRGCRSNTTACFEAGLLPVQINGFEGIEQREHKTLWMG